MDTLNTAEANRNIITDLTGLKILYANQIDIEERQEVINRQLLQQKKTWLYCIFGCKSMVF